MKPLGAVIPPSIFFIFILLGLIQGVYAKRWGWKRPSLSFRKGGLWW